MKHHHTLRNGYFSVCRGKNNLLALRFGDSTAESPGDATHVDAALTLCAEFSSPHPHASNDPPRVLSPNPNLQFLSWRMWAFFAPLIEVHRWWHAQGNAFPHTPHHCQTPAVPVLLIFGAEGGRGGGCPRRWRDSLWSRSCFFPTMAFVCFLRTLRLFD